MQSLLDQVNILIKMKVGDPYRLEHIKLMLKQKRTVYGSDRAYLDHLIHDYIEEVKTQKKLSKLRGEDPFEEAPETTTSESVEDDYDEEELVELEHIYCWKCGKSIPVNSKFCLDCGSNIKKPELNKKTELNVNTGNIQKNNLFCYNCGSKILENTQSCTECGSSLDNSPQTHSTTQSQYPMQGRKPSAAWYLLPIFFTIIGGIISWACIRDRDPGMAKNNLILGIMLSVIPIIVGALLFLGLISLASFSGGVIDSSLEDEQKNKLFEGLPESYRIAHSAQMEQCKNNMAYLQSNELGKMYEDRCMQSIINSIERTQSQLKPSLETTSKCGAGTVFDDTTNTCLLEGTQTTSKCGAGTVFDDATNTCLLK